MSFKPIFQARERVQRRLNKAFDGADNNSYSYIEQRYIVGGRLDQDRFGAELQYLFGNTWAWTKKINYSFQNSDLYVGEGDWRATGDGTFRFGRQILAKGGQRIFEESRFGNRLKSFDLARFQSSKYDIFTGRAAVSPNAADRSSITGGSAVSPFGETVAVFKHDTSISRENYYTLDQRYVLRKSLDYEFEGAAQTGVVNGDSVNGWFLHGRIGHGIGKDFGTFLEADAFSGGKDGSQNHEWVPLYQPAHDFYGLANDVGPINLNYLQAMVYWNAQRGRQFTISLNHFELRNPSDGWYATNLQLMTGLKSRPFLDPAGKSGRELGNELDFRSKFQLGQRDFWSVELAAFQPGDFIRSFNGKTTVNQLWGIIYYQYDL